MIKRATYFRGLLLSPILLFFLCSGCNTGKNTATTRAFHEFTTRYNVYHNAEQAYQEALEEQLRTFTDSFDVLLPIYTRTIQFDKNLPGGPFDGVVERMSRAISTHSITAKPRRDPTKRQSPEYREWLQREEFNPFLSNAWMLLGKAHVQNGDLEEALAVFSYIGRTFPHEEEVVHEASIWMLRCYTEQNSIYQAEKISSVLRLAKLPNRLQPLFDETYTAYLLKRGDYSQAIPMLQQVVSNEKSTLQKKRLQYLMAQLLQITGEQEKAYQAFERVKGLTTPFPLALHATIGQLALSSGEQKSKHAKALARMKPKATDEQLNQIDLALAGTLPSGVGSALTAAEKTDSTHHVNESQVRMAMEHDSLYQVTYQAFMKGDTTSVGLAAAHFSSRFPQSAWLPQIKQMHQLSSSGNIPKDSPPGSAWNSFTQQRNDMASEEGSRFLPERNGPHLLLLAYENSRIDRNKLLFTTAAYNFSQFRLRTFHLTFRPLGAQEALLVSPFHSYNDAHRYALMLLSDSLFTSTIPEGLTPVVISEENLSRLNRSGDIEAYYSFAENELEEAPLHYRPVESIVVQENATVQAAQNKKIVPLDSTVRTTLQPVKVSTGNTRQTTDRLTPDELRAKLEQNARQAIEQLPQHVETKDREKRLKERERERERLIRLREKEMKERARKREEQIKKREKERKQKIRNR